MFLLCNLWNSYYYNFNIWKNVLYTSVNVCHFIIQITFFLAIFSFFSIKAFLLVSTKVTKRLFKLYRTQRSFIHDNNKKGF